VPARFCRRPYGPVDRRDDLVAAAVVGAVVVILGYVSGIGASPVSAGGQAAPESTIAAPAPVVPAPDPEHVEPGAGVLIGHGGFGGDGGDTGGDGGDTGGDDSCANPVTPFKDHARRQRRGGFRNAGHDRAVRLLARVRTVHVGDRITWTNADEAPHDAVTTSGPAQFRSPTLQKQKGQSWSYTFTRAGTYAYCSIHPEMRARVVVVPEETAPAAPTRSKPASTAVAAPSATRTTHAAPATKAATPHSTTPSTSAAAAPTWTPAAPADQHLQTTGAVSAPRQHPLLLLTGLVTAVAVSALLLLGFRAAHGRAER